MTETTPVAPPSAAEVAARRAALFRETPGRHLARVALGTAWALKPRRIGGLPALGRLWLADLASPAPGLPDPARPVNAAGACGIVHDLAPETLVAAYARGLFPLAHFGPLKWMSPAERFVLPVERFHLEKEARRVLKQGR
ncbi:hypothetical protein A33M_3280 [Rhodovulum sp. PH10]|uniref:hypothetical protein n=1 Tax=Rhodovulum sp. PH10 TaxID=1187851 RepID=UPI00027C27CD|nr:hypothetical protein [Rhodovulum sp. PH10]EJW11314.1 hypothetical protein A33M_3280 [Rhodovulum sp. PH10]